ncbi:Cytosol aminopeptidase [Smittium mucronatum]|uniref:Cytosol aminopeptidase n=1 Tax=Smittium mucronatum TaxID=133383 RepID=A0A1R0GVB3_9FUNG|nr:Cytosol aminopeptidase [Smittium mucronatum]
MYSIHRSSKIALSVANRIAILNANRSAFSTTHSASSSKGLILAVDNNLRFVNSVESGPNSISPNVATAIINEIKAKGLKGKLGECHVHFETSDSGAVTRQIAVVGLGKSSRLEHINNENLRMAIGTGIRNLKAQNVDSVDVEIFDKPLPVAEGAYLGKYKFDSLKSKKEDNEFSDEFEINPVSSNSNSELSQYNLEDWNVGRIYAESQNFARDLVSTPANLMTPTIFSETVAEELAEYKNVTVNVYDEEWAKEQNLNLFTSVTQGSDQPCKFVEIIYRGKNGDIKDFVPDVALVGKGVTFDSGGINIKPSKGMESMKGDMGGAASVVSAIRGAAALGLPINIVSVTPLVENLINGSATKPGDVFTARNGKTVEILNTDAEGRLVLADGLTYVVDTYNPPIVIDVATLTGAMAVATGELYAGVFTDSEELWTRINDAALATGDLVWRMPLHPGYLKAMSSSVADFGNISSGFVGGGSSTAAAFLSQFLGSNQHSSDNDVYELGQPKSGMKWAHLDIAGVMDTSSNSGYHVKGMTGRPTRALIELLRSISESPL